MHYSFFFFRTTAAWAWGRARHGEKILIKPLPLRIATILTMAAASISPANSPVKRSTDGEKAPYGKKAKLGGLPITVGVVDCNGGGVRVLMIDGDAFLSACRDVLTENTDNATNATTTNATRVQDAVIYSLGWHVSHRSASTDATGNKTSRICWS